MTTLLGILLVSSLLGQQSPGSTTADAINRLLRAESFDAAHEKIEALSPDDPVWERLASLLYFDASRRKDYLYLTQTLTRIVSSTSKTSNKSAALVALGRAERRQGRVDEAVALFESAAAAAPDSAPAREAGAFLYDIRHLSIGLHAPAFSATTRDGKAISLESLRGSVTVLLFWGST